MEPKIEIVNIVATLKLNPMPSPSKVLERIPGTRPLKRFRGALLRIDKIPVLFYRSKVIVAGVRSIEELDNIIGKLVDKLNEHGFNSQLISREVVNVTLKAELYKQLDLYVIADRLGGIYDPDYRPYAIVRVNGLTALISQNGRIVILGAKGVKEALEAMNILVEKLQLKD